MWEDAIEVVGAFLLKALLLHTGLLCSVMVSFLGTHRSGLEHKRPFASMKRLYKCSLIIWVISDQSHPSEVIAVGHWQSACA